MPAHIASKVTSTSFSALTGARSPTTNMRLVSPYQPSSITVTSMLAMSPSRSRLSSLGMPWLTTWLTEMQQLLG